MNTSSPSSDFWLTMVRAFMPPMRAEAFAAFRDDLACDLEELCASLKFDAGGDIDEFQQAMAKMASAEKLLGDYSHLFLQPPIPATLNLARYVDGSLNGPCLDALENAYRAAGIEKTETLHDLSDHAVMQMEFMAFLMAQGAESAISPAEFAQLCLGGALPRFAAAIAADSPASPFAALSRIAAMAIRSYVRAADAATPGDIREIRRHDVSLGVWRHCASCQKPFAREKEIKIMARALEDAGLPADHLSVCPTCRDKAQGYFQRRIG